MAITDRSGRPGRTLDHDTVIVIATGLLDDHGVEAVTLAAVAERAGVTQPALYRHVDGAAGLWRSIGLATRQELADHLGAAALGQAGPDAVRAVAAAWRGYASQHPGRYRSTERFPVLGDDELEAAVGRVVDVLATALRGFDLSVDDTRHAALMLRSALHGFVSFELGDGNPGDVRADDTFNRLITTLCAGFDSTGRVS